jgi:exoribonuclease R
VLKALSIAEIVISDEFQASEKINQEFVVLAEVVVAKETSQTSLTRLLRGLSSQKG